MPAHNYFPNDWIAVLGETQLNAQLTEVGSVLSEIRAVNTVFPEEGSPLLFQAFRETPFSKVRVVIVGQDPYHDGSFNGLAFGNGSKTERRKKISPSLKNILAEVERTEGLDANPNLYSWANQGVLLINTAHTVVEGQAGSHLDLWSPFTSMVITALNQKPYLIWMLWGGKAQAYLPYIGTRHDILKAGHPSPLNTKYPFNGCNCFQDCNLLLKQHNYETIVWD